MFHKRYLNFTGKAIALGLRTSILSTIPSLLYVLYFHNNLYSILFVIGVFVVAIVETIALNLSIEEQIKYCLIISICAGITTTLGSISSNSILILSLGIVAFMWIVGLSANSNVLPATTILFIADLYVVGSGLPTSSFIQSIIYGLCFCSGGVLLIATNYLQYKLYLNKYPIKPRSQIRLPLFSLTHDNIIFSIKLSIAVCGANLIAIYLNLPQEYCAPMTALLILKIDHDFSWKRINHRLFGTVLGGVFAASLVFFIHNQLFLALLMLPIMFFTIVSLARHYGAYVFFLTVMISILFNLTVYHGIETTLERVLATLLGVAAVILTIQFAQFTKNLNLRK